MHKYYSSLIGENSRYTNSFQPSSKRKIALYANCLAIPVILWFINGYLIASKILNESTTVALLVGLVASFIIFLVERSIIMSNGSKPIFWFRIALGFIIAALGSISFDEVIFSHDIDNKIAEYKNVAVDSALQNVEIQYQNKIASQQLLVDQKASIWNRSLQDAKEEADGTGGSRQKAVGKIAQLKMEIAAKQETDYILENNKLLNIKMIRDSCQETARYKAEAQFDDKALLLRVKAMFDLICEDGVMLIFYILFTAFLFCLEFVVVIIKITSKNSIDEELEYARDFLIKDRAFKILDRRLKFDQSELLLPSVKEANRILSQQNNTIF